MRTKFIKFICIPVLFCAGMFFVFAKSSSSPESEVATLRKERDELRLKLAKADEELRCLRLLLGGVLDNGAVSPESKREEAMLSAIDVLCRQGLILVQKTEDFSDFLQPIFSKISDDPVLTARLKLRLEEIKSASRSFCAVALRPEKSVSIRSGYILAISKELGAVALSCGAAHGVVPGIIYRSGKVNLRVVATRPFVSVAVVVSGDIDDLTIGAPAVSSASGK